MTNENLVYALLIVLVVLLTFYLIRPCKGSAEPMVSSALSEFYTTKFPGKVPVIGLHYTDWCHYCKEFKPIWASLKSDPELRDIKFFENNEEENKTQGVSGFPTLVFKSPSGEVKLYEGERSADALKTWLKHQV